MTVSFQQDKVNETQKTSLFQQKLRKSQPQFREKFRKLRLRKSVFLIKKTCSLNINDTDHWTKQHVHIWWISKYSQ